MLIKGVRRAECLRKMMVGKNTGAERFEREEHEKAEKTAGSRCFYWFSAVKLKRLMFSMSHGSRLFLSLYLSPAKGTTDTDTDTDLDTDLS